MRATTTVWLLGILSLTVVPGCRTIAKAEPLAPPAIPLSLPECAEPALRAEAKAAGCRRPAGACLCSKPEIFPRLMHAIHRKCSLSDQDDTRTEVEAYCGFGAHTAGPTATSAASSSSSTEPRDSSHTTRATHKKRPTRTVETKTSTDAKATTTLQSSTVTLGATSTGKKSVGSAGRVRGGLNGGVIVGAAVAMLLGEA